MENLSKIIEVYKDNPLIVNNRVYELKSYDDKTFSLQRNVFGPCGDKIPHPSIKFKYLDDEVTFIHYADFEISPVVNKLFEQEDYEFFDKNFKKLLTEFDAFIS